MTESKDAMNEKYLHSILEDIWHKATIDNYVSHTAISRVAFEYAYLLSMCSILEHIKGIAHDRGNYRSFKNYFIEFTKKTFTPSQIVKEYAHITETSKNCDCKKVSKYFEDLRRELNEFAVLEQYVKDSKDGLDS